MKFLSTLLLFPAVAIASTFNGCSTAQETQINSAIEAATTLASSSYTYLKGHSTATLRYVNWFGSYESQRAGTVSSHFEKISTSGSFNELNYDCTCKDKTQPSSFTSPETINLCPSFWTSPVSSGNSQAGALINSASQVVKYGGTNIYAVGPKACEQLATSNPDKAIFNAGSHQYFAENTPPLS